MINRKIENQILHYLNKYPILTLTGVRQSGKSTLLKNMYKDWTYVSLEDPDNREYANISPRDFLKQYDNHIIIDEVQRAPQLFSYLQTKVDGNNEMGQYILSGSHNFSLMQGLSQSLAGRTAILTLAPFSIEELSNGKLLPKDIDELLFKGGYPAIYDRNIEPYEYFQNYIDTYIERDVRLVQNISNATSFIRFIKLLAIHSGNMINYTQLANECDISVLTLKSWLSILIQSYIVFELPPYYKNISKRLVKSPKIYFYDTGLLCYMLGIDNKNKLKTHDKYGYIFETLMVSEYLKQKLFIGKKSNACFYRDTNQLEVDLIDETTQELKAYEIKSSENVDKKYLKNLLKIGDILNIKNENLNCIYTGQNNIKTEKGNFINYKDVSFV